MPRSLYEFKAKVSPSSDFALAQSSTLSPRFSTEFQLEARYAKIQSRWYTLRRAVDEARDLINFNSSHEPWRRHDAFLSASRWSCMFGKFVSKNAVEHPAVSKLIDGAEQDFGGNRQRCNISSEILNYRKLLPTASYRCLSMFRFPQCSTKLGRC
jgi:hypothetical protein